MIRDRNRVALPALLLVLAFACVAQARVALAQAPAPAAEEPPPLRFTVTGFRVSGDNPLSPAETDALLAPFLGEYSGVEGLLEAATTLERALARREYSFHRVVLPAQTLREGTVELEVVAFKLGEIFVKGNKHFSRENVLASMPALRTGEAPRTRRLSHQRFIANQHPSKKVELRLKESERVRAIDAHLDVQDADPHDLFLGINNTGNNATGDFRITGGFQHSNLSDNDDQAGISVTVSPTKIDRVEQFGLSYAVPLYSVGGLLSLYVADSDVNSGTITVVNSGSFDVSGAGRFLGGRYTHFLRRIGGYTHSVNVGVDDKRFDNNVTLAGQQLGTDVRSRPLSVGYAGSYEHERGVTSVYATYVRNIPRGRLNSRLYYSGLGNPTGAAARVGSDPVWDAVRFGASADLRVAGDWLLRWRGDGQLTDEPLISGEQFGAGGARSVRGYEEREVSGDVGFFTSLEAWSPPFYEGARAIAFVDVGHVRNKNALVAGGKKTSEALSAVGVGLRWFWRTNFSLEADLARTLNDAGSNDGRDYKLHFNAFYRF